MSIPEAQRAELLGFVPSPPDPRDYAFRAMADVPRAAVLLPRTKIPYTPSNFPLYNQIGPSCVGNSRALSATIDQRRDVRRTKWYDGEELYARCKEKDGVPSVAGTFPRVALKIQQDRGAKVKKSPITGDVGKFDKIDVYTALYTLEEIKVGIFLYGSVTLGSTWYENWFDLPVTTLRMPVGSRPAGGHAYTAIGWSEYRQALLIQNSWGTTWGGRIGGAHGRGWMPYELLDWSDFEAWRAIDTRNPR